MMLSANANSNPLVNEPRRKKDHLIPMPVVFGGIGFSIAYFVPGGFSGGEGFFIGFVLSILFGLTCLVSKNKSDSFHNQVRFNTNSSSNEFLNNAKHIPFGLSQFERDTNQSAPKLGSFGEPEELLSAAKALISDLEQHAHKSNNEPPKNNTNENGRSDEYREKQNRREIPVTHADAI